MGRRGDGRWWWWRRLAAISPVVVMVVMVLMAAAVDVLERNHCGGDVCVFFVGRMFIVVELVVIVAVTGRLCRGCARLKRH